ncbi:uncharacterized protein LOC123520774 [Portunus trituberculatus]|uniref:uncharacterized protein LOC123520774 n=1 Tax=Portunus trituberculatus TaxID=210409 RepID=UPI001E1CB5F1|nr:uncharacterized protein LOC123520774 [Portunus trituberculatus]
MNGIIIWQLSMRNNGHGISSYPRHTRLSNQARRKHTSTSSSSPSDITHSTTHSITHSTSHSTPPSPRSHSTLSLNAIDEKKGNIKIDSSLSSPAIPCDDSRFFSEAACPLKTTGKHYGDRDQGDKGSVFYKEGNQRENKVDNEGNGDGTRRKHAFLITKTENKDVDKFFKDNTRKKAALQETQTLIPLQEVFECLHYTHTSVNFLLYILCGASFRQLVAARLRQVLCGRLWSRGVHFN